MKVYGSIILFFAILYNIQVSHRAEAKARTDENEPDVKINLNINVKGSEGKNIESGHRELQSRAEDGMRFYLHGTTGKEKVIITDGDDIKEFTLPKSDQVFYAKTPKINIDFTNDECCNPDRNVMFTSGYPYRITTRNNEKNYILNWNCWLCSTSNSRKIEKQMDLQSRRDKVDKCYLTRSDDDCAKCKIIREGQFCMPGNYTVEFKTKNQCENVTFGGCDIPKIKVIETESPIQSAERCNEVCDGTNRCNFYRYNSQTKECQLMDEKYRASDCNIRAGPTDKSATQCLFRDNDQLCDSIVEEDCEYHGDVLKKFAKGDVTSADSCKRNCEIRAPGCKYWIFHKREAKCILKKDGKKTCSVWSGLKMTKNEYDYCQSFFHNDQL